MLGAASTICVSTVFLVIDHNYEFIGPPLLWETMIFRDGDGQEQWRSATREEALAIHAEACCLVLAGGDNMGRGVRNEKGDGT